jgi:drug/metabolite transporter (DMT)-like permease
MTGYIYMVLSAFFFCLMTIFVKLAGNELQTIQIVFFRAVFTLITTYYLVRKYKASIWGNYRSVLFLRGITGSIALFFVYESLQRLSIPEATVIQYLYPIFTAIFGVFFLHEKLSVNIYIAILLGLLGVYTIFEFPFILSSQSILIEDLSIAMIGACLTGAAYVLVRKSSKLGESPYTIMFYFPFFSVLISLPFMFSTWAMPSMLCWVYIFFVGVFTQLGQLFLTFGYKILPAGKAASTSYVQVPFSIIAGMLLFKDSLTIHFIIGSLVIFFSIFLIINDKNKNLNNYS